MQIRFTDDVLQEQSPGSIIDMAWVGISGREPEIGAQHEDTIRTHINAHILTKVVVQELA